jgi:NTE family protein
MEIEMSPTKRLTFPPKKSLLTNTVIKKQLEKDLPKTFEELSMNMYVSATDISSAHLITFNQGNLVDPILGSMAIPGVFPTIDYQDYLLMDGGLIDNFPTTMAQKMYPHHKIIGVALNKFREYQTPKSIVDSLLIALEIMLRKDMVKRTENMDIVFYEEIDCGRLERNKTKLQKTFEQGYKAGMQKFSKLI